MTLSQSQSANAVFLAYDNLRQGTLNLGNYTLSAASLIIGDSGNTGTVQRGAGGTLALSNDLQVNSANSFTFGSADVTPNLSTFGASATLTTASTTNVTNSVQISNGGTLNLGANLSLTSYFIVGGNGSIAPTFVNAGGYMISAASMSLTQSATLTGENGLSLGTLELGSGNANTIHGLNDTVNNLVIENASTLTIAQASGQLSGFTLSGNNAVNLNILDTSVLNLQFGANSSPNWIFRWADPSGGNWISTLNSDIASGQISVSSPDGYSVYDQGGYTYIGNPGAAVPEPSSFVLFGLGAVTLVTAVIRRRSRPIAVEKFQQKKSK